MLPRNIDLYDKTLDNSAQAAECCAWALNAINAQKSIQFAFQAMADQQFAP